MQIAQTTLMAASLAILIYLAIVATGLVASQDNRNLLAQQQESDLALRDQIETNVKYMHSSDTNRAAMTVLLNGITLRDGEFILLYDSTPYSSKGHIALNLPCDGNNPNAPLFKVLVGRAPDIVVMPLGYIAEISAPPDMCVYHTQFGFGDPVTDIVLKNTSGEEIALRGPHSVSITSHESFIPTSPSFKDIQHERGY
ncbi:MAG: hypothetical protein ACRD99_06070 [Nitrososphaera sp.]